MDFEVDFGSRLKRIRIRKELTQKELGKRVGVSEVTIGNWERGVKAPGLNGIVLLCEILETTPDYLLGRRSMDVADALTEKDRSLIGMYHKLDYYGTKAVDTICDLEYRRCTEHKNETKNIRYITKYLTPSAAGSAIPLDGENAETVMIDGTVPTGTDYAVVIQGDSMMPYISDGETVYVKKNQEIRNGDVGIFCVDGMMYCKQYYLCENGDVYLLSANESRQDANIKISADGGTSLQCEGVVLMDRIPIPDYFEE